MNASKDPIIAVIDIGTNSVKLLVGRVGRGSEVDPVLEVAAPRPARLGRGLYPARRLQPAAMAETVEAIHALMVRAREFDPVCLRLVATCAVREARNRDEFVRLVQHRTGLPVEIISGHREAEWVHRGVTSDCSFNQQSLLIWKVGGGSTEVIASGDGRISHQSFALGTVRLMDTLRLADPPTTGDFERCQDFLNQFFGELVVPQLVPILAQESEGVCLVATGGIAACLANLQIAGKSSGPPSSTNAWLPHAFVTRQLEHLWRLPLVERQRIPGVPTSRADIILTGAAIFEAVMRHLKFPGLYVTRRGMRYGALMPEASRRNDWWTRSGTKPRADSARH